MSKNTRKLSCLLAAMMAATALVSCGNKSDTGSSSSASKADTGSSAASSAAGSAENEDTAPSEIIETPDYMNEADVIGFVNKYQVPVVKSPCPADGYTKREYTKELLKKLNQENPGVKERMFTAIQNGNLKGWCLENGKQ